MDGADADIVVWDPKQKKTITAQGQQSAIDYNVFEGFEVDGPAALRAVARQGVGAATATVKAEPGHGKFVPRAPKMAVNRALSRWKEITAPRKVERTGVPATGV